MDFEKTMLKFILGFVISLAVLAVLGLLAHWEKTWPAIVGVPLCWLVGHITQEIMDWNERKKMQKWADDFYARYPDNRDASKTAEDRIRADAERQKAPTSDSGITPIIMGAAAGYMAGSYASSHSDNCSSDSSSFDSGSSSSDSGSCGGE